MEKDRVGSICPDNNKLILVFYTQKTVKMVTGPKNIILFWIEWVICIHISNVVHVSQFLNACPVCVCVRLHA